MRQIALHLAHGLAVRCAARVEALAWDGAWSVRTAGEDLRADALVLTPPVPQAMDLLRGLPVPGGALDRLTSLQYHKCIAVLVRLRGPSLVPEPGAVAPGGGGPIDWIADSRQKGISPDATALTLHASADYSERTFGLADETVVSHLLAAADRWIPTPPIAAVVHRWRYSRPKTCWPERCVFLGAPGPLVLCGDAFGGTRVEGAALSGHAAADALLAVARGR
jgi:predicted NAD/FAD-dependent oxidoreductase